MDNSTEELGGGGYGTAARFYDLIIDPLLVGLRRVGLSIADPPSGAEVLDIACGTGTFLRTMAARGHRVAGVDLSHAMIAQARQNLGPDAELHIADATDMPLEDDRFDQVSAVLALHEMPPEVRLGVLREAARVCKRDGRLLLIDYHPGAPRGLRGRLQRALTFSIERAAGGDHYRNYRQFMRAGGLPALLAQAGLDAALLKIVGRGNFAVAVIPPG